MTPSKAEHLQFASAAENANITLSFAEDAFAFLARLHGDGDYTGNHGFAAICHLCAEGLGHVVEKHGESLVCLARHLRNEAANQEVAS